MHRNVLRRVRRREIIGRARHARLNVAAINYLQEYCNRFSSWINYIATERILETGQQLTLEFVGRALDEGLRATMFGPSLGLLYALAEAFIESETVEDGFRQWNAGFLLDRENILEARHIHDMVARKYLDRYEFRRIANVDNERWGIISKNACHLRIRQMFRSNITARFLVKLFDARSGIESDELRVARLGHALAERGRTLEGDRPWHAVFNQGLVLPNWLMNPEIAGGN